jgi:short-subunit dehydrogenase involved in D-alanine esterification of teichoic acids
MFCFYVNLNMETLIPYLPKDIAGKTILITGCTNYLGRNTAYMLTEQGAKVILIGDKKMELDHTFGKLKSTDKESNWYEVIADNLSEQQLDIIYTVVDRKFHGLDILINNDIVDQEQLVAREQEERGKRFQYNLQWHKQCSSEAIKRMLKNGGGHIYNVTSLDDVPYKDDPELRNTVGAALRSFNRALQLQIDDTKIMLHCI